MKIQKRWLFAILTASSLIAAQSTPARKFYAGPGGGSMDGPTMDYQVRSGETLFDIAERFLGSPYRAEELAKANQIADPLRIKAGTAVRLPAGKTALQYSIHRLSPNGEFLEHNPEDAIPATDRFTIAVTSNVPGYLYAFNRSADGVIRRIFPAGRRPARITAFAEYVLPPGNYFRLDRARGDEEVWLMVAREAVTDLDALADGGVVDSARMDEIRSASTEKGVVVAGDGDEGEPVEVVEGDRPSGRILVAHPIRIKRK